MPHGFEVGDRVRATANNVYIGAGMAGIEPGTLGTVVHVDSTKPKEWPLKVSYDAPDGPLGPWRTGLDEVERID